MPKASDWTDYIPASGEASVGLNLKGRYGGRSNNRMRKRYSSRSRFSKQKRGQRYWFPAASGESYETGWVDLDAEATPISILSYTSNAIGSTTEPSDMNQQLLLMTQGPLFARIRLLQETPENPTPTQLGNHDHQFFALSYFWSVDELTSIGSISGTTNFSSPAGALSRTPYQLRRKDMLNWGVLPLMWENTLQMYGGDTTQVPNYQANRPRSLPWTRIPPPRIPKGGIRLGLDRTVSLHTTIMDRNLLKSLPPTWLAAEFYQGHFRWLLAK